MANINARNNDSFLSEIEKAREDIRAKFLQAHKVLTKVETDLLAELESLAASYEGKDVSAQIQQLTKSKEQLLSTLKGNDNYETLEKGLALMDHRIEELQANIEASRKSMHSVVLEWDEDLDHRLSKIGKIKIRGLTDYRKKGFPLLTSCKHRPVESTTGEEFYSPKSVAIDAQTKNVYICDFGNNRVQVLNESLQFLFMFSEKMREPVGVCVNLGTVYVTQNITHSLCVYTSEGKFLQSVGRKGDKELEFQWPRGVDISSKRKLLYICDCNNNRIHVLNLDLTFNSFIPDVYHPRDVKVLSDLIFVLKKNSPCVRQYNYSHQLIRELVQFEEKKRSMINPNYFCIDGQLNILMTDQVAECVLVFSRSGELTHRFGKRGEEKGEFIGPRGIALDAEDRIVVVSSNPDNCVQLF